jgi:hypothetical protein
MTGTFEGVGSLQFTPDNKMAYAYSGFYTAAVSQAGIDVLTFTTNSEYIEATLIFNGFTAPTEPTYGDDGTMEVKFNGVQIAVVKCGTAAEVMPSNVFLNLIIPPHTLVNVKLESEGANTSVGASVLLTGKVNGAIEQENLEAITDNNKWASK